MKPDRRAFGMLRLAVRDPQAQQLQASREDIFSSYDRQVFEEAFRGPFRLLQQATAAGGSRMLYGYEARVS